VRLEFKSHNMFKETIQGFLENDPHLAGLKDAKYIFHSSLEEKIPVNVPGIYILTGARQVGKSTLIKLIIKKLLEEGAPPQQIFYIPCDIIDRYRELLAVMQEIFEKIDMKNRFYIFLDEITYVKEWDRAVKYFADMQYFKKGGLLITGSDSLILKESMKKFPGRRGESEFGDFHLWPLSFSEYLSLTSSELKNDIKDLKNMIQSPISENILSAEKIFDSAKLESISRYFEKFLLTGGFLSAINNYEKNKKIGKYIYRTYQQWVVGDFLKRGKNEDYLKDLLNVLSERISGQVTFHSITAKTEIQHHLTVREYLKILEDMDVLFIQQALREDRLKGAPRKAKKIHFTDPFIAQALICWARDIDYPWEFARENIIANSRLKQAVVEGCISSLFSRKYRIYYIKSGGEVDLALVLGNKVIPVEVKWTEILKKNDLRRILK